jgi:hypothetical protein
MSWRRERRSADYASFALEVSSASPSGAIIAKYRRARDVKSGSFARPA